jgi:hypothetical protein
VRDAGRSASAGASKGRRDNGVNNPFLSVAPGPVGKPLVTRRLVKGCDPVWESAFFISRSGPPADMRFTAMSKTKRKQASRRPGTTKRKTEMKGRLEPLQIRTDAAGIDVGATELYVAVPPEKDARPVRTFESFTRDLHALADWLEQCGVRSVAMESTGVYWIPVFQVLEERGVGRCDASPDSPRGGGGRALYR